MNREDTLSTAVALSLGNEYSASFEDEYEMFIGGSFMMKTEMKTQVLKCFVPSVSRERDFLPGNNVCPTSGKSNLQASSREKTKPRARGFDTCRWLHLVYGQWPMGPSSSHFAVSSSSSVRALGLGLGLGLRH